MVRYAYRFPRRAGCALATARGHVRDTHAGVKLEHEHLPATSADEDAMIAAEAKRARKAARRSVSA